MVNWAFNERRFSLEWKLPQNQKLIFKKLKLDHTLVLRLIEHSTKEDFIGMKNYPKPKIYFFLKKIGLHFMVRVNWAFNKRRFHQNKNYPKPENYFLKKIGLYFMVRLIEHSTKEDFIGIKTTKNQKFGLYFRVRVNWAFNKRRFHQNKNYPKPKIWIIL